MSTENSHSRLFAWVWIYLLILTAVEIVLAYAHILPPAGMLALLMALSVVKAGLIVAYFMHMRFEKPGFVVALVPATIVVIALLFAFFPDSYRLFQMRVE
jgi:cytochrome c oxidase subunit 4